ncbi:TPA: hypothetical protein ACX6QT_000048 [Photobacterium damselae]|uniref:hypothetical protein n=1 Tax=Photobacterium damselae TaxID=38293 RepID=UPI003B672A9A
MLKLLGKILLNAEAKRLGDSLVSSNIKGAEVVGRGTIVVDGKVIASSKEFLELKEQAKSIIESRRQTENSSCDATA